MAGLLQSAMSMVTLRHKTSGVLFDVPENYLYRRGDKLFCSDFSDAALKVDAGEAIKLIVKIVSGAIVKKDGVMGWYFGEIFRKPFQNS